MTDDAFEYVGDELDLFSEATNWKQYWSRSISRYIGTNVLDVGAGIGATAHLLASPSMDRWVALEPDPSLAARISEDVTAGRLPESTEVQVGLVEDLPVDESFDTIIYADVLEHIQDDRSELERAARHLRPGGHMIVLSPAHQSLFTPFDEAIGHFRRYNRASLREAGARDMELVDIFYLDSVGVLASMANRILLRSAHPTRGQIKVWDRLMVPVSRAVDPVLGRNFGKSIIAVWRRPPLDKRQAGIRIARNSIPCHWRQAARWCAAPVWWQSGAEKIALGWMVKAAGFGPYSDSTP